MEFKEKWIGPLFLCTELTFIIDEKTKKIIWLNGEMKEGQHCWSVLMGRQAPCPFCPKMKVGDFYSWECYNRDQKQWLKIKYNLFIDDGKLLRAGNINVTNDMMELSHDSIEEVASLQLLLKENSRIKAELERDASCDLMTGLYNRNKFNLDIASGIFDQPNTGVLYFDINNLKVVNDQYRHDRGDKLICCTAAAIHAAIGDDFDSYAYRIGGDEFVIMSKNCNTEHLNQMIYSFYDYIKENPTNPVCEVAAGSAFSDSICDAELLVIQADNAMYEDKKRLKAAK